MNKYFCNPPAVIKRIFNEFVWDSGNNKLLFTFDDGPIPGNTQLILKFLNDKNIKAVFFCVGENVIRNPQLVNEIIAEGHTIGNHTMNHKNITGCSETVKKSIIDFNKLMQNDFGITPGYFRPPHGRINLFSPKLLRELNIKTVMWSLLTYDFKNDFKLSGEIIRKYLKQNSIIVFHDSIKSARILPDLLEYSAERISEMNYSIGEPGECLFQQQ